MMPVDLHHVIEGPADAPVVLMGNSLGSNLGIWDAQAQALSDRFRVVRYDLRGHGRSPVPEGPYRIADLTADVLALLDRLDIERAHLVGLSLSAMVAMHLAATAPSRVDHLVLCCTSAYVPPASNWLERAATVRAKGVSAVADAVLGRWVTPAFAAASPAVVERLRAMLEATPDEGYASASEAIATMDLRPQLPRITAPTLVLAGSDDAATPVEHAQVIADAVPHARLAVITPAAHLACVEQPDVVTRYISDHLVGGAQT